MRPCTDGRTGRQKLVTKGRTSTGTQKLATRGKATYYREITNNQQQKTTSTNQQSAVSKRSGVCEILTYKQQMDTNVQIVV